MASATLPRVVLRKERNLLVLATRALNAIWPTTRHNPFSAVNGIGKVYDGFLKSGGFHALAGVNRCGRFARSGDGDNNCVTLAVGHTVAYGGLLRGSHLLGHIRFHTHKWLTNWWRSHQGLSVNRVRREGFTCCRPSAAGFPETQLKSFLL